MATLLGDTLLDYLIDFFVLLFVAFPIAVIYLLISNAGLKGRVSALEYRISAAQPKTPVTAQNTGATQAICGRGTRGCGTRCPKIETRRLGRRTAKNRCSERQKLRISRRLDHVELVLCGVRRETGARGNFPRALWS